MALPQMPQDPASGAARTAQTAVEMALDGGFEVRALGTTATERGSKADPLTYLQSIGLDVRVTLPTNKNRREFRFVQRGIHYTLLDTGRQGVIRWEASHGRQFDLLFARLDVGEHDEWNSGEFLRGDPARDRPAENRGTLLGVKVAHAQPRPVERLVREAFWSGRGPHR